MSAYACEPGKGSEPEVGWQWALQMARFHDVVVLTRENNRTAIERALEGLRGLRPLPAFVYFDRGKQILNFKRRTRAIKWYYLLWQRLGRELVAKLHAAHHFDLMHHVTFAGFRYPTVIWGHGVPTVWGPVGGIESVPFSLLPWGHPRSLATEFLRSVHNAIQSAPFLALARRANATTTMLVSTPEMRRQMARLGCAMHLMPTIGLDTSALPVRQRLPHEGPLRLLFVGNIITLKGVDLALRALKASHTDATFTLIGDGNYLAAARRLATRLGLEQQVNFRGRLPRHEVLEGYSEYDVLLFPSLHDTGGYAVIEAMMNELPVICLDRGGPAVAVEENCGVKIPIGTRQTIVTGLAAAIRGYDQDRSRVREHGRAAREIVLRKYEWERKGEQMNELYQRTVMAASPRRSSGSQMGGSVQILHGMFSTKGVITSLCGVLLVGMLGFFALAGLKREAVRIAEDTLPGLSYSGAAMAYLAELSHPLNYLVVNNAEQRSQLRSQIIELSQRTSENLEKYRKTIDSAADQAQFDALVAAREEFFRLRDQTLALADSGKQSEALLLYNKSVVPAQARVRAAGDKLFEFNMRDGQTQSRRIVSICNYTQLAVVVVCIVIFVVGFFFGFSR